MTRKEHDLKRFFRRSSLSALGILALLLPLTLSAQQASAELRVRAEIRTPNVRVRLGNDRGRMLHRKPLHRRPILRSKIYSSCTMQLTGQDRHIAKRMAYVAGTRKGRLLKLRRSGFSWREIGWDLGLSRREMHWAINGKTMHGFARKIGPKRIHRGR